MSKTAGKRVGWLLALVLACLLAVPGLAVIETHTGQLVNTFSAAELLALNAQANIAVAKTVVSAGKETISPEGFTFALTKQGQNAPLTAVSDAQGAAAFALTYDIADVGEHVYTLREIDDGREGVSYDPQEYEIRVAVAYEGGKLTAKTALNGAQTPTCVAAFENTYCPPKLDLPFTGDTSNIVLLCCVLAASVAGIVLLYRKKNA